MLWNTLYGATESGGRSNRGTIFKSPTDGTGFTVLKDFSGGDGETSLLPNFVRNHSLRRGCNRWHQPGRGTLFKLNIDGAGFNVIKHLLERWRIRSAEGFPCRAILYTALLIGEAIRTKALFLVNVDGSGYMVLKHFGADGAKPISQPILAAGAPYGTTRGPNYGSLFRINTDVRDLRYSRIFR